MKKVMMGFIVLFFVSCGLSDWEATDLTGESLYVLSINPEAESSVSTLSQVELIFSKPLAVETVTPLSLFIITLADYQLYEQDWDDLHDEVEDGDITTISYTLEWSDGNQKINLVLTQDLEAGEEYVVVALPLIQASDYMPLDQTVSGFLTKQFSSSFLMVTGTESVSETEASSSESSDENSTQTDSEEASYPQVSTGEEAVSDDSSSQEAEPTFDWQNVLITEVVPDPQQDHSESTIGNDVLFDDEPGTGTVSSSDEYIEIFNGTEESVDVSSWSLNMVDGTDVNQALGDSEWDKYFSAGGSLEYLQAGEFVVLGDPEGTINNSVSLELLNELGEVIDSVEIDDANASGVDDEAYYRGPDGEWLQGLASPGYFLE